MASEYEGLDSGTLYQAERALREESRQTMYGDEGERRQSEIDRELKQIKDEWSRRSDR